MSPLWLSLSGPELAGGLDLASVILSVYSNPKDELCNDAHLSIQWSEPRASRPAGLPESASGAAGSRLLTFIVKSAMKRRNLELLGLLVGLVIGIVTLFWHDAFSNGMLERKSCWIIYWPIYWPESALVFSLFPFGGCQNMIRIAVIHVLYCVSLGGIIGAVCHFVRDRRHHAH